MAPVILDVRIRAKSAAGFMTLKDRTCIHGWLPINMTSDRVFEVTALPRPRVGCPMGCYCRAVSATHP